MASITAIMRSGYYILTMLPRFVWLPVGMRTHLRHAKGTFEDQLIQSGLDQSIAHELANTYHEGNKRLVSQFASPRAWRRLEPPGEH